MMKNSWLAACSLLAFSAASAVQASPTPPDRLDRDAAVAAVRQALLEASRPAGIDAEGEPRIELAQWPNWGNWANWNNWQNWSNWPNWGNY